MKNKVLVLAAALLALGVSVSAVSQKKPTTHLVQLKVTGPYWCNFYSIEAVNEIDVELWNYTPPNQPPQTCPPDFSKLIDGTNGIIINLLFRDENTQICERKNLQGVDTVTVNIIDIQTPANNSCTFQ